MSTPRALRAFTAVIALFALGLGLFLTSMAVEIGYGLGGIVRDTGPSAVAARKAATALSDMDRQLAMVLLGHRTGDAELRDRAESKFVEARRTASRELEKTGGDNYAVIVALAEYESLAGRARQLIELSPEGGKPTAEALAAFRDANGRFNSEVRPAAEALAKKQELRVAAGGPVGPVAWTLLLGALLAGAMIALQWFLDRRTHRMFNPPLMIATFTVTLLVAVCAVMFGNAESHRLETSEDSLADMLGAERARQISYGVNADHVRAAADPGFGDQYERDFLEKSQKLLHVDDASGESYAMGLPAGPHSMIGYSGLIAEVVDGFTTADESGLESAMYTAYRDYQVQAAKARDGSSAGGGQEAVDAAISDEFAAYEGTLAKLAEERRSAFFSDLRNGPDGLSGMPYVPGLVLLIALGIGFAGVWPRLAEYR